MWRIEIGQDKLTASKRNEVKEFLSVHRGKSYKIYKAETNELYEAGIVDATSGDDLEYGFYK